MKNKVADFLFWGPALLLIGILLVTPWLGSASGLPSEGPGPLPGVRTISPGGLTHFHVGPALVPPRATTTPMEGPGPVPMPTPPVG